MASGERAPWSVLVAVDAALLADLRRGMGRDRTDAEIVESALRVYQIQRRLILKRAPGKREKNKDYYDARREEILQQQAEYRTRQRGGAPPQKIGRPRKNKDKEDRNG